ncbi:MAG: hypothetical protein L6420_10710 [Elusimicrobia bacterium]|nr:hypothetical protein [Elusimicrobiota bacterium]
MSNRMNVTLLMALLVGAVTLGPVVANDQKGFIENLRFQNNQAMERLSAVFAGQLLQDSRNIKVPPAVQTTPDPVKALTLAEAIKLFQKSENSSFGHKTGVYSEDGYYTSEFPKQIQQFINKIVARKCFYSDYISGFYEDPVEKKDGNTFYTVEIVLRDYEGNGWITVMQSEEGDISLINLECPNFFH